MTSMAHVIGVDPGLVDTGLVSLTFDLNNRALTIEHGRVAGEDAAAVTMWVSEAPSPYPKVYVEQYKPRQNLNADTRMLKLEADLRRMLPNAKFLTNMGIKRVVTTELMQLLDVWSFPTATHHQDIRAAARIALLGMMKNDATNHVLAEMVREHIDFQTWTITHV